MQDITSWLQQAIAESGDVQIPKGDYALQSLQIPKDGKIVLSSKDRVRLLHAGKRNRPMFSLGENALLVLREKIEIYYNTNNLQDVSRLMIKCPLSSRVEISPAVKISLFSMKQ